MIRATLAALLVVALVLGASGTARAQDLDAGVDEPVADAVDAGPEPEPEPTYPRLAGYVLVGKLLDAEASVRAVLDEELVVGESYTSAVEEAAKARIAHLQYELVGLTGKQVAAGVELTFEIRPFIAIRHISIEGNSFSFSGYLFGDEIFPRIHLRPGSRVPSDEKAREADFDAEAARLEEWLAKQGFFEARVSVFATKTSDPYQLNLVLKLAKGPLYELGRIKVTGNVSIPEREILALMRPQNLSAQFFRWIGRDDRFTKDGLNDSLAAIRALYQRTGFPGVRVKSTFDPATSYDRRTKTVSFTIEIREKRKIDVAFEGNDSVPQEKLEAVLTFNQEASYDDVEVASSADALRRLYQTEGFYQATVTWERVRLLPTFERILFYIDEGPRLFVRSIDFLGNTSISSAELKGVLSTREDPGSSWGRLFGSGGYLTAVQLAQDIDAIAARYRTKGFANVTVRAAVVTDRRLFDEQGNAEMGALAAAVTAEQLRGSLHIRFTIIEGAQDLVETVSFYGNSSFNDSDLLNATVLRPGAPWSASAELADVARIRRFYQDHGYPYAEVAPSVRDGTTRHRVRHEITEGKPVRMGKVFVRGNFKTRSWVVADVLGLREGDLLTLGRVRSGQEELRQTGLFASVRLDLLGIDQNRDTVHALIEIQERYDNKVEGEFSGGVSSDNTGFLGIVLAVRNILGVGASVAAKVEVGTDIQYGRVDAKLPYWLVRRAVKIPFNLTLYGFGKNEDTPRYGDLLQAGFGAELSRSLGRGWFVSGQYNWVLKQIDMDLVRPAGASEDIDEEKVEIRTGSLGVSVVLDRRTDARGNPVVFAPSRGYRLSASALVASTWLGGTDDFLKLGGSAQLLRTIDKKRRVLLTFGVRYDHGVPISAAVLPETERFLAGGDTTVRGLEEDRVKTEIIRNPLFPGGLAEEFTVIPAGGNIRFLGNLDLQFRVWDKSIVFGWPIASAIFLDTGLVTNSFANFAPAQLRHSLGIALARVVSPIGNFSLEYAIPLDPQLDDDPTGRFHFNLGFVF